jgi:O-antigen biosynthesis protein
MMMTRHPSYLPFELMACGALVITNENRYTHWLLEDEQNCLLSETTSSAMAAAIERGLNDANLRRTITRRAAERVRNEYSDWDSQAEKIYNYVVTKS